MYLDARHRAQGLGWLHLRQLSATRLNGHQSRAPHPHAADHRAASAHGGRGYGVFSRRFLAGGGAPKARVQLGAAGGLRAQTTNAPATLTNTLVTLSGFPGILGCPGIGVLSLANTNPIMVFTGLD